MTAVTVDEIQPGLFLIDHNFQGIPGVIGSYLLAGADDLTLIETGPSTTLATLLAGVRACGFEPEDITQLAVTHIHLDHAGSAGVLVRKLPRARVLVHPAGAPHLIDPSKLLVSASRVFGDAMERLWGEVQPVPAERVDVLEDGATFTAGGRTLTALDTPGHAFHHFAYHDAAAGLVFTGDVAGVRLGRAPYVRPPTVPPEFKLELWRASAERLRALRPRALCLTHFGQYEDVDWHLDDLLCRLFYWSGWVEARLEAEPDTTVVAGELRRRGDAEIVDAAGSDDLIGPLELATSYQMTVDGMARYFQRRASARASAR